METQLDAVVYAKPCTDNEVGYELCLVNKEHKYWMNDQDILIQEVSCYVNLPTLDRAQLAQQAINTLRDKQKRIKADAYKEEMRLEKLVQELLTLPYIPEEPNPDFEAPKDEDCQF